MARSNLDLDIVVTAGIHLIVIEFFGGGSACGDDSFLACETIMDCYTTTADL